MREEIGEIECLACGKAIKPRQLNDTKNYDVENYDGQIVCQECKSLLHVKLVKGKVQKHKIIEDKSKFNWTNFVLCMQEERNKQENRSNGSSD